VALGDGDGVSLGDGEGVSLGEGLGRGLGVALGTGDGELLGAGFVTVSCATVGAARSKVGTVISSCFSEINRTASG
jgi:hypothetical protein